MRKVPTGLAESLLPHLSSFTLQNGRDAGFFFGEDVLGWGLSKICYRLSGLQGFIFRFVYGFIGFDTRNGFTRSVTPSPTFYHFLPAFIDFDTGELTGLVLNGG